MSDFGGFRPEAGSQGQPTGPNPWARPSPPSYQGGPQQYPGPQPYQPQYPQGRQGPPYQQQPYQQQPYQQYPPLPAYAEPPRRRGRALIAAIATGAVVVLTAGGVYAYSALSGGPAALAEHTPGDAVAYLEVNLDPPAAQKVAAIRFLRKFPAAKTGDENGTLLTSVVEPLAPDEQTRRLIAENVESWLGKHAAVIGDPQNGKIQAVVLAETTDPARTTAGIDQLNAQRTNPKNKIFYNIQGDIAYLAASQQVADTAARDGSSAPLSDSSTFTKDVATVGDDGIVSLWADLAAADRIEGEGDSAGRIAGSLRFTDTTADLQLRSTGSPVKAGAAGVGPRLATLPGDTAVAVGLSGADQQVRSAYAALEKAGLTRFLAGTERDYGLRFPDDIAALVGSRTVIAMGPADDRMGLGVVSTTDDAAGAARTADRLLTRVDPDYRPAVRETSGGVVVASSAAYADRLEQAAPDGQGLGQQELFTTAMPEIATAGTAAYVDVARWAEVTEQPLPADATALRAVGLTATNTADGVAVHVRVVAG